jgi:hypothetical protein
MVTPEVILSIAAGHGLPVGMSATKSRLGHAEPAAGGVGIHNLANVLSQTDVQPFLHLRTAILPPPPPPSPPLPPKSSPSPALAIASSQAFQMQTKFRGNKPSNFL